MNEELAEQILKNVNDPGQRKLIGDLIAGKVVKYVKCMSKECKGRIIAHIMKDGRIRATTEYGLMYLLAHRPRFDGYLGFQCLCGNDSRLCEQEKGIRGIEENCLSAEDIVKVGKRLKKKKNKYDEVNGKQLIDNFLIENF